MQLLQTHQNWTAWLAEFTLQSMRTAEDSVRAAAPFCCQPYVAAHGMCLQHDSRTHKAIRKRKSRRHSVHPCCVVALQVQAVDQLS